MEAIKTRGTMTGIAARLAIAIVACALAFVVAAIAHPAQQAQAAETQTMYRLYNPNTGEHFYTAEANENNELIRLGWVPEGDAWAAPLQGEPVYRMYNPNGVGEHHYTTSSSEVTDLEHAGWTNEGVRWFSDPANNKALHSLYNPNAFANNHHYTSDWNEIDALQDLGWIYEDEKWYGVVPGQYYADIDIRDYGTIRVAFNATAAPKTVENFVELANKGFYDGLTFHRVLSDFMMQGGDPTGTGSGGSGKDLFGEFLYRYDAEGNPVKTGWDNPLHHKRGAISMANAYSRPGQNPNSASSQFFICQVDALDLDGHYAAFGCVMSGIEIVDKICEDMKPYERKVTYANGSSTMVSEIPVDKRAVINTIKIGTF